MTREEYIRKQQELRKQQNEAKRQWQDKMDLLNDQHLERQRAEMKEFREAKKKLEASYNDRMTDLFNESEALKTAWEIEHPYPEVAVRIKG